MDAKLIRMGICVIIAQCILLAMTLGFNASMDRQAEKAGIYEIINNGGK